MKIPQKSPDRQLTYSDAKRFRLLSDSDLVILTGKRGLGWKLVANELLGRQQEWLLGYCIAHLGNQHDAQDVMQEVLLRAYNALPRFEGRSSLKTWLYTIAQNQCRSFAVRRARYIQTDHIEELINLYLDAHECTQVDIIDREVTVSRVLESVTPQFQQVLRLRFFKDFSLQDIAKTLNISLSAAKMRLYRAIEQFKVNYYYMATIS